MVVNRDPGVRDRIRAWKIRQYLPLSRFDSERARKGVGLVTNLQGPPREAVGGAPPYIYMSLAYIYVSCEIYMSLAKAASIFGDSANLFYSSIEA
jgi:hypothetical protein